MKKSLMIIALSIFILTSATATAENNEKNASSIGSINFTDRTAYVLDHTSDPAEGNWITLGYPDEERRIQLPHPIKLTYYGPKHIEYGGASGTLYKDEDESYTITYPSNFSYLTHPVYLPGERVNMSFHGDSSLKGEVEIYLFKGTSDSAHGIFDAFKAGDIGNLDRLFHSNMDGNHKKYTSVLGENGDLLYYDLGPLDSGQYCIVMIQENEDKSLTVLSATAFIVAEYELLVSAPEYMVEGENLNINMNLKNASDELDCTYGAVLINEEAYKADIEIDSDGTKNGTSLIVNDIDIIDEFGINSSNYRSKLTKNELQTELQTLIGEGEGSIAIGEAGQRALSLTSFDLPDGYYYLLLGAYIPGKGLAGITQLKVEIKPKGSEDPVVPPIVVPPIVVPPNVVPPIVVPPNVVPPDDDGTCPDDDGTCPDDNGTCPDDNGPGGNDSSGDKVVPNGPGGNDSSGDKVVPNGPGGNDSSGDKVVPNGPGGNDSSGGKVVPNGSGGDGSGSSGSGGRSPEPSKNIESKELCKQFISKGNQIRFEFTKEATSICYIEFIAKKTVGKTTAIVEQLKVKSILTSEPEGEIYKHINIWVGNNGFANPNNIENATVGFKVSKDWINEKHINMDSLTLQHFNGKKWNSLPTRQVDEDEEYIYLEAETPSLSPFAITTGKDIMEIKEKTGENQVPCEVMQNDETKVNTETGAASQENKNTELKKFASFFVGFLIVLLMGAIIRKRKSP